MKERGKHMPMFEIIWSDKIGYFVSCLLGVNEIYAATAVIPHDEHLFLFLVEISVLNAYDMMSNVKGDEDEM